MKKKVMFFSVLFLLTVLVLSGCDLLFDNYKIEGRILDGRDESGDTGLAGVNVSFSGNMYVSTTTDSLGYFTFPYVRGTGNVRPNKWDVDGIWTFEPESITVEDEEKALVFTGTFKERDLP